MTLSWSQIRQHRGTAFPGRPAREGRPTIPAARAANSIEALLEPLGSQQRLDGLDLVQQGLRPSVQIVEDGRRIDSEDVVQRGHHVLHGVRLAARVTRLAVGGADNLPRL